MTDPAPIPVPPLVAEDVDLGVLGDTLNFFIRSLNIVVTRDLNERLGELGLARGTGKITTLFLVENHPGIRPSVIADVIFKDRSAMGRIVDDMVGEGLVRRETDASDLRAQALFLTEDGAALAVTVRGIVEQSNGFFAGTDPADYAEVLRLLRQIYWRAVASKGTAA